MASPQVEDGYTPIANEIVEALWKINLSAYECRVLWYLFRKTYGWNKKTDWIALSQFSKDMGLDRRLIHRAIHALSSKKMIVIYKDDSGLVSYGFQKDYDKWNVSSKRMTVIKRDDDVSSKEIRKHRKLSSKEIPTKAYKLTKETITKDTYGKFVQLSKDEYVKLEDKFNSKLSSIIEAINLKIESKGLALWRKDHKSDYATILYWDRQGWLPQDKRGEYL
jgi:phage replication O-like protein O